MITFSRYPFLNGRLYLVWLKDTFSVSEDVRAYMKIDVEINDKRFILCVRLWAQILKNVWSFINVYGMYGLIADTYVQLLSYEHMKDENHIFSEFTKLDRL